MCVCFKVFKIPVKLVMRAGRSIFKMGSFQTGLNEDLKKRKASGFPILAHNFVWIERRIPRVNPDKKSCVGTKPDSK